MEYKFSKALEKKTKSKKISDFKKSFKNEEKSPEVELEMETSDKLETAKGEWPSVSSGKFKPKGKNPFKKEMDIDEEGLKYQLEDSRDRYLSEKKSPSSKKMLEFSLDALKKFRSKKD